MVRTHPAWRGIVLLVSPNTINNHPKLETELNLHREAESCLSHRSVIKHWIMLRWVLFTGFSLWGLSALSLTSQPVKKEKTFVGFLANINESGVGSSAACAAA